MGFIDWCWTCALWPPPPLLLVLLADISKETPFDVDTIIASEATPGEARHASEKVSAACAERSCASCETVDYIFTKRARARHKPHKQEASTRQTHSRTPQSISLTLTVADSLSHSLRVEILIEEIRIISSFFDWNQHEKHET